MITMIMPLQLNIELLRSEKFQITALPHLPCLTIETGDAFIQEVLLTSHSFGYVLPSLPHAGLFVLLRHFGHWQ